MIDGVIIKPLRKICDDRGRVMHFLRRDDPEFKDFGEVYFSTAYQGVVKGWHNHTKMTLTYCVVAGMIKLVMYDNRVVSPTSDQIQEVCIGDHNYCLVQIPPGVWNGWMALTHEAIVCNCTDIAHDPTEIERFPPHSKLKKQGGVWEEYDWRVKWR